MQNDKIYTNRDWKFFSCESESKNHNSAVQYVRVCVYMCVCACMCACVRACNKLMSCKGIKWKNREIVIYSRLAATNAIKLNYLFYVIRKLTFLCLQTNVTSISLSPSSNFYFIYPLQQSNVLYHCHFFSYKIVHHYNSPIHNINIHTVQYQFEIQKWDEIL